MDKIRNSLPITSAVGDFLNGYGKRKQLEPGSISGYKVIGNNLSNWMKTYKGIEIPRLEHLNPKIMEDFFDFRTEVKKIADGTFNVQFALYEVLFNWLYEEEYLHCRPLKGLFPRKENKAKRQRAHLKEDQYPDFEATARSLHPRDEALVFFMAQAGRRQSEIKPLRWDDIHFEPSEDFKNGYYHWVELKKLKQEYDYPLSPTTNEKLQEWKEVYRKLCVEQGLIGELQPLPGHWYVFPAFKKGTRSRQLNPTGPLRIGVRIRQISEAMGIAEEGHGGHLLRRLAADRMEKEEGIEAAQLLLNHTTPAMTARYINKKRKIREMSEVMDRMYGKKEKSQNGNSSNVQQTRVSQDLPDNVVDLSSRFGARRTS